MSRRGGRPPGRIRVPPGGLPAARMMPEPEPGPLTFAPEAVVIEHMAARAWLTDHPLPAAPEPPEPDRKEPEMAQLPPGPVREAIERMTAHLTRLDMSVADIDDRMIRAGDRLTGAATSAELLQLRAEVAELREMISKVESEVGIDDADARIVAFLEALGGVKMNGMSIATNLGLEPGTCANRLQRLAREDRIHAHREKKRATLYSVPLR